MCIRDRPQHLHAVDAQILAWLVRPPGDDQTPSDEGTGVTAVSYTHLRAHETVLDLVCRLLLEKKKKKRTQSHYNSRATTHTSHEE